MSDVPHTPRALTAPAVKAHRRALEARLVELRSGVASMALAAVGKKPSAAKGLATLRRKVANLEFEIAANLDAFDLAQAQDAAAHAAWRASVHELPPADAIEGIGKDSCRRRCAPGAPGGCVLTGGCPSSECLHPVKQMQSFHLDHRGKKEFSLRRHSRASEVFAEAVSRLKVEDKYA